MDAPGAATRLGELMRTARKQAGLTIEELSGLAGVGVRTLGDIERSRIARPHRRTVEALVEALKIGDAQLTEIWAAARPAPEGRPTPSTIVGRSAEIAELERWFAGRRREHVPGPLIVSGLPGIGKSTLLQAFFAARLDDFPDGRVCLDLGGSGPAPMDPGVALGHLLEHAGVPREQLPETVAERAILYRRRLQGLTMLIGLSDARDEAQIRPLLPDNTSSLIGVTTRRLLAGLPASKRVVLREPGPAEAMSLLETMAGPDRVAAEPEAAAELIRLCGRLPLAMRVAATRLTTRPGTTIADIVERLSMPDDRLDRLVAGDVRLRDVLDRQYRLLPAYQQRAFRRLCVLRHPILSANTVAAATEADQGASEEMLERLVDAGVLAADGGQFVINSLFRQFGREKLAVEESAASVMRLLEARGQAAAAADGPAWSGRPRQAA